MLQVKLSEATPLSFMGWQSDYGTNKPGIRQQPASSSETQQPMNVSAIEIPEEDPRQAKDIVLEPNKLDEMAAAAASVAAAGKNAAKRWWHSFTTRDPS